MSNFNCPECGKTLKTKIFVAAGKKIRCPTCRAIFRLTEDMDAFGPISVAANAVSAKSGRAPIEFRNPVLDNTQSDDNDEVPGGRRTKKPGKNRALLLGLAGLLLVLALVAVAGFVWPGFLVGDQRRVKAGGAPQAQRKLPREGPNADGADFKGEPKSSVRGIMQRLDKGPQAIHKNIGKELNNAEPNWDALTAQTTEYIELTKSLAVQNPPRGSKESWDKLCTDFGEASVNLDKSAKAKNREDAQAAFRSLGSSCMACHQAHRGPPGGFGGPKGGKGKGPPPGEAN